MEPAEPNGAMEPAESIGRLGFSRWYERRLIEGHAWFVSAFICVIAIAACAEELAFRGSIGRLFVYVALGVAAGRRSTAWCATTRS